MFDLNYQQLLEAITVWGYPLMLLLMILEGPIVTLGAAFMASMGFFNVFIVYGLSVLGDMIGDIILYSIGYLSKKGILPKNKKVLRSDSKVIRAIEKSFEKKGSQIIFFTKATTGLCYVTFILAGMAKLDFKKFLLYSFLGGLVWSGFTVIMGFYFGEVAEQINRYIKFGGWIIFGLALLILSLFIIYKKSKAIKDYKKIKQKNGKNKK